MSTEATRTSLTRRRLGPSTDRPAALWEPRLARWYAPGLSDPLGDRLLLYDNTGGDALEMLRLRAHLTRHPKFEASLRAQTQILKGLHSPSFAAIHSVERLEDTGDTLAIVSGHVPGVRLSEVLNRVARGRRRLSVDAALFIAGQVAHALSALHSHAPGLTHGALTPERIILTAGGTVTVVEHAIGAALAGLGNDRQWFWTELQLGTIAGSTAATIGPRTDVLQIGLVALSTLLGRNLKTGDFPHGIDALLSEVEDVLKSQGRYPLEPARHWLARTLQRSASASFQSAVEAASALSDWCDVANPEARHVQPHPAGSRPPKEPSSSSAGPRPAPTVVTARHVPPSEGPQSFVLHRALAAISRYVRVNQNIWIPVSAVASGIAIVLVFVVILMPAVFGNALATLVVTTVPGGATVRIDGQQVGATPLRQMLEPGTYELEVSKDGEIRRFAIALRRNHELTQYVEMSGVGLAQPAGNDSPSANGAGEPLPLIPTGTNEADAR